MMQLKCLAFSAICLDEMRGLWYNGMERKSILEISNPVFTTISTTNDVPKMPRYAEICRVYRKS